MFILAVQKYYGKYRALVVDLNDPEKRGRIRVQCPEVLGDSKSPWCEICVPVAYEKGGDFCLPKLNDFVWVEFESGNPMKPIWLGGCWSIGNTSLSDYSKSKTTRVIEFDGCRIEMEKGKILITNGEATIRLEGANIYLN